MLSMMDHITRRLDKLDSKNDDIKTEKKEPKLRFDKKVQKCQGDFVICGDIYQRKRARSCHILSHRVTNRPLTLGKAYEVSSIIRIRDERTWPNNIRPRGRRSAQWSYVSTWFQINVDVSDSLDPVSREDVNVILVNENGEISGKSKVVSKKDGIYGVRFMCKLLGTKHTLVSH